LVGGGLVAAAVWWSDAARVDVVPIPAESPPLGWAMKTAPGAADALPSGAGAEVLAARLDVIVQRLQSLEQKIEALAVAPVRTSLTPTPVGAAIVDASSLQAAMEEIERRRLEAMSDDALQQMVWKANGKDADPNAALRALDLLLARAKTPEARAKVLTQMAMAQRSLGGDAALAASAKSLQTVIDEHGFDSEVGLNAAYQMVWTRTSQKDPAAARQLADAIVRSPAAAPTQRVWARWAGATAAGSLGDAARERCELEALLRDIGNDDDHAKLAHLIQERLNPGKR
jgi:hypothetical protein